MKRILSNEPNVSNQIGGISAPKWTALGLGLRERKGKVGREAGLDTLPKDKIAYIMPIHICNTTRSLFSIHQKRIGDDRLDVRVQ